MKRGKKNLLSGITSLTTTRIAQMISYFGARGLLRRVGWTRRSSWPENLAYLGVGVVVGGVGALLLAPGSGGQTRARLVKKAGELGEAASKQVRELGDHLRDEVEELRATGDNHQPLA